jgi:hypothetical protein
MEIRPPQPGRCPMNTQFSRTHKPTIHPDDIEKVPAEPINRRTLLKIGGLGASAAAIVGVGAMAWMPKRVDPAHAMTNSATSTRFPDIQFDLFKFLHPQARGLDHVLLCRVGGGYIFAPRLLLAYFVSLEKRWCLCRPDLYEHKPNPQSMPINYR